MAQVYFVTGIDTGIGKTYATGYLAKCLNAQGKSTITQKLIQTGNDEISEDIQKHRELMGVDFLKEDHERLTMPEIFTYPASPHLASKLEAREIDFAKINHATEVLKQRFDVILLEGAGGLMVPLTKDMLTLNYIQDYQFPIILVTSGRLGSINHTLLTLEVIKQNDLTLYALAYNLHDESVDPLISQDTSNYLKEYLLEKFPDAHWIDIPKFNP